MYEAHPTFKSPDSTTVLWRYTNFTKFVSLLDTSALFFTRADKLGDPFEGSYSQVNVLARPIVYKNQPAAMHNQVAMATKELRRFTLVNCWHANAVESAAMWRLYSREHDGIAIKTTFKNLSESFLCDESVYIGEVQYIDYNRAFIPENDAFAPFLHKRKSFAHEHEVRALTWHPPSSGQALDFSQDLFHVGTNHSVDLSILLQEIIVAPYADDWFVNLVEAVVKRYNVDVTVRKSGLSDPPVWA